MPITMNCSSCGKTLSVPDTAAGKKAKCPACGQIMTVPEVIREAEEFGATDADPAPPEFNLANDIPGTAPSQSPAYSAGPRQEPVRRPCPMCGELIMATAGLVMGILAAIGWTIIYVCLFAFVFVNAPHQQFR